MKKVTAIFDIGKTNKKFFLFDENYKEVFRDYKKFDEIEDEDGYPCDDLGAIQKWAKSIFKKILKAKKFDVTAINFSTYGASLVHLDKNGKPLTPLYNYTKPIDQKYINQLYDKHGGIDSICRKTASPSSGMLNSGIQLYWLKYHRPEVYSKIRYSLHLPQYMSFLFTGIPLSDYTSIGCHTMLWDYEQRTYHDWVVNEEIDKKLAPIVETSVSINMSYKGKKIKVGPGIHDSSAALIPYLLADSKPFLLISTGTWSITLNPFNANHLTEHELNSDCLNYMSIDGKGVRASRLFLGNEYNIQIEKLRQHFDKKVGYHKKVAFSSKIFKAIPKNNKSYFHFESLATSTPQPKKNNYYAFTNFETAYHQLMYELMNVQIASSQLALSNTEIKKVYIDGGFTDNEIFVKLVSYYLSDYKIRTTKTPLGSALGAALIVNDAAVGKSFFKKSYSLTKHKPLILEK